MDVAHVHQWRQFRRSLYFLVFTVVMLVLAGVIDAELGDKHSVDGKRGNHGLSIFVSSIDFRKTDHAARMGILVVIGIVGPCMLRSGLQGVLISFACSISLIFTAAVLPNMIDFATPSPMAGMDCKHLSRGRNLDCSGPHNLCIMLKESLPRISAAEFKRQYRLGKHIFCVCVWVCVGVCGCVWVCMGVCLCVCRRQKK